MTNSRYAWWNLTKHQKAALQEMRQAGMFGGMPGRAPYMWVQEGSINPASAEAAAIEPTRFVENAIFAAEPRIDAAIESILGL